MRWLRQVDLDTADAVAVEELAADGTVTTHTYGAVFGAAVRLAEALDLRARGRGDDDSTVGILTGNGVAAVIADIACQLTTVKSVPIPLAFAREQARHLLRTAITVLVDDQGTRQLEVWGGAADLLPQKCEIVPVATEADATALADARERVALAETFSAETICKIVHTSGTTSTPKGVMLRRGAVDDLLDSIRSRVGVEAWQRYVSVVPMSLLVEQVFAVYLTFLAGGTVVFLPEEVKPLGTAGSDVERVRELLPRVRPTVSLVPPSLVESLAQKVDRAGEAGTRALSLSLYGREDPMLLFSGGAPVSDTVLRVMWDRGLPVYVAYGLSENGSVATLNAPGQVKLGTVGRPLNHCQARVSESGELLIKSTSQLSGYLGSSDPSALPLDDDGWLHTGDIALLDNDGYVTITGRLKNVIITSNGRNVSPEWVEAQYKSRPAIESAVVFGDNLERLVAVFVLAPGAAPGEALSQVREVNAEILSEIEQVAKAAFVTGDELFHAEFFTVTGRPRRTDIWTAVQGHRFNMVEV